MVNFDKMKEKALATAGKMADKSVGFAKAAGDKAKIVGKITKLRTEIAMEKDTVRKSFTDIGKLYYEKNKANPDPEMEQVVEEVTTSLASAQEKQKEIEALKKELADDFGEAMEEVKDRFEDLKEEAAEVVEEIVEKVEANDEE